MGNFKRTLSDIYTLYSNSPKMKNELKGITTELATIFGEKNGFRLKAFRTIFDIRWAFSSKAATDALLNNLPGLVVHLKKLVKNLAKALVKMRPISKSREVVQAKHAKLSKCLTEIQSFPFLAQLCLVNDCLTELTHLSLVLQKESIPAYLVWAKITSTRKSLEEYGFICSDGVGNNGPETESLFKACLNGQGNSFSYRSIQILPPSENEMNEFVDVRKLFCSTLTSQINRRFGGAARSILECAEVFNPATWSTLEGSKETFGGYEIRTLAMLLGFDFRECSLLPALFRNMKKGQGVAPLLKSLIVKLETLPFTTAECERGFSMMNLIWNKLRNKFQIETVESNLFVKINGPPPNLFRPNAYVFSWLLKHRSPIDQNRLNSKGHDISDGEKIAVELFC